jgi:hypothetical protein
MNIPNQTYKPELSWNKLPYNFIESVRLSKQKPG